MADGIKDFSIFSFCKLDAVACSIRVAAEATCLDRRNVQLNDDSQRQCAFIADYIHLIISLQQRETALA